MENYLTIQEMSGRTGISGHTLRYYEKVGLIEPVRRDRSGHRQYSEADLNWVLFLVRLRTTGMPIRHMQQIAELRRQGPSTAKERRELLEAHKQKVEEQVKKLQEHLGALEAKIEVYRQWESEQTGRE